MHICTVFSGIVHPAPKVLLFYTHMERSNINDRQPARILQRFISLNGIGTSASAICSRRRRHLKAVATDEITLCCGSCILSYQTIYMIFALDSISSVEMDSNFKRAVLR